MSTPCPQGRQRFKFFMEKVLIKKADRYNTQLLLPIVHEILSWSGVADKVSRQTKILLKPNMLNRAAPQKVVTTHPAVLDAVITALKELGAVAENITVADSSGGPESRIVLRGNYKTCGFTDITDKHGVNLYVKQSAVTVKTDGKIVKSFELLEPAVNSDIIISLAKFKTHVMTGMSGAVKNLFGLVPGLKKAEFHMRFPDKANFADMIVDLCETVKPDLTIVDGIIGMEGDGPAGGDPRHFDMILAGTDPYSIDLSIAYMMGFERSRLPIARAAISRGLCPSEANPGDIEGDVGVFKPIENFKMPKSYGVTFSEQLPRALNWATPAVERLLAPKPRINTKKCIGCGKCRDICPQQTIAIADGKAKINLKNCIKCFCCHEMCPAKAIDVKRNVFFNI